jgi:hypothetical protein
VYDPVPGWDFFQLIDSIRVPAHAIERVQNIVGNLIPVLPNESN